MATVESGVGSSVRTPNPFLAGALGPVHTEVTAFDLEVTGTIPEFLDGRYLRNGPNPAAEVDPDTYHWFAGDAMVHGLSLLDGTAQWYRNRWVRNPAVARTLGETPPPTDPRAGMLAIGPNTNVLTHAGQTLALVEGGGASYKLTEELDTVGTCDFDGTLYGGYTAHPHMDPKTGELHAISYSFGRGNHVEYTVIDTAGRVRRKVDIKVQGAPMMHDFSLTDKYVVIYDLPVTFDPMGAIPLVIPRWLNAPARLMFSALLGKIKVPSPIVTRVNRGTHRVSSFPFAWNPDYQARIGVMAREGDSTVRWFDIEPCYVFHPLNAYTEDRDGAEVLVLDVVRHQKMFDRERRGPSEGHPRLDRWEINLATGAVRSETTDDREQEFPRINESFTGLKHRYGYTVAIEGLDDGAVSHTAVYKQDFQTGRTEQAPLEENLLMGEVSFVPNPGARSEDDGLLIGLGQDRDHDAGQLVILDAATLESVARVHLPQRVPMGFHGNWCPR